MFWYFYVNYAVSRYLLQNNVIVLHLYVKMGQFHAKMLNYSIIS